MKSFVVLRREHVSCTVNNMAADAQANQGAKAPTAVVFINSSRNIPASLSEGLHF